jgi:hypothetical protein
VPDKLGLTKGASATFLVLGDAPPTIDTGGATPAKSKADVVLIVCRSEDDVRRLLARGWAARKPEGRLWALYEKGKRTFTRTQLGAAVEGVGLGVTWFRQVSLGELWSGVWFKHRSEFRTLNR